jgi:RNA 3'-terminal phosphate cyclase (ATP)
MLREYVKEEKVVALRSPPGKDKAVMLHLDGSRFSGSGTIVRFGVPLAALTGQVLHLTNIRARRDHPGLRPQHLKAVEAVTQLCQGTLEGGTIGSQELLFRPGRLPQGGSWQWDIGTAGSTTMLALALLPVAAFARGPHTFHLTGGLFQDFAPSAFHLQHALLPLIRRMGLPAELHIRRPGYVPTGGGSIALAVTPVDRGLSPLTMPERGGDLRYWGLALSSHLQQRQVSQRMADACQAVLKQRGLRADMRLCIDDTAPQAGAALALFAEGPHALLGADQAGARRRPAEAIGRFVASALLADLDHGATVDRHLADQVIIFAALASGTSTFLLPQITDHVQTNLWLVETLLGARARFEGRLLYIEGVGYVPSH